MEGEGEDILSKTLHFQLPVRNRSSSQKNIDKNIFKNTNLAFLTKCSRIQKVHLAKCYGNVKGFFQQEDCIKLLTFGAEKEWDKLSYHLNELVMDSHA